MSKYFIFKKDDVGVQAVKSGDVPTSEIFEVEEITRTEFLSLKLPCIKENGVWVHTDEMPEIEYPSSEVIDEPIETPVQPSLEERIAELEAMLAALKQEVK